MAQYKPLLRSDAQENCVDKDNSLSLSNVNSINTDIILEIQKEIDSYDLISLVFLLYEIPDTALQRLIVFQRVSKDVENDKLNLLYNWALNAQTRPTWKYEFLEALTICRLYNILRKLGFKVSSVERHYLPDDVHVCIYVDPMKKMLYRLCENITLDNLCKLKKTLLTYEIDTTEHEYCELVFLELMCHKFIKLNHPMKGQNNSGHKYNVENLTKIIEMLPGYKKFAVDIREIENKGNNVPCFVIPNSTSTPYHDNVGTSEPHEFNEGFDDVYKLLNELQLEDVPVKNLKSDTSKLSKDMYTIKNPKRIGLCCIINEEEFHPSKDIIEGKIPTPLLENRHGSTKDQITLEKTMSNLNFVVKTACNLDHKEFFQFIKDMIENHVNADDSMFVLCILSHGIRGHVFAADSVKVNVEHVQNLLDDANKLHGIPKILILQACQVDAENVSNPPSLIADGPSSKYYLRKMHFLIYWATAPEYEAYRDEKKGSIFIQMLCGILKKRAEKEQLYDIFTKVTDCVTNICTRLQKAQVPIFKSTLIKKLYLQLPD